MNSSACYYNFRLLILQNSKSSPHDSKSIYQPASTAIEQTSSRPSLVLFYRLLPSLPSSIDLSIVFNLPAPQQRRGLSHTCRVPSSNSHPFRSCQQSSQWTFLSLQIGTYRPCRPPRPSTKSPTSSTRDFLVRKPGTNTTRAEHTLSGLVSVVLPIFHARQPVNRSPTWSTMTRSQHLPTSSAQIPNKTQSKTAPQIPTTKSR